MLSLFVVCCLLFVVVVSCRCLFVLVVCGYAFVGWLACVVWFVVVLRCHVCVDCCRRCCLLFVVHCFRVLFVALFIVACCLCCS